jgi:hypothetical protein
MVTRIVLAPEIKTDMLERLETLRSKSPTAVAQEMWGLLVAYNLVRPKRLATMRDRLRHFVLPPRRPERVFPRAVKIKMSNYPRKRPTESSSRKPR